MMMLAVEWSDGMEGADGRERRLEEASEHCNEETN